MNIKSFSTISFILLLSFTSCDQFVEMNTNPNEPTTVTNDVLMASSIRQSMTSMTLESFLLGNNIAQLTSKTLRVEVDAYNWNAFPTVWEGLYESLTDVEFVETRAAEAGNDAMEGAALVLKSWIYSTLTNAYGDIPYSQAIKGGTDANYRPAYDAQEDIYASLLSELARAESLLASGNGSISGDILLNDDATKWRKLANSLRLRLLMTANNKIADAGTQFAAIVTAGNIMTSNDDNATLTFLEAEPNKHPLVPLKQGDFDAVALAKTSMDAMLADKDPRLMRYARPDNDDFTAGGATSFLGADAGDQSGGCSKVASRLGVQYFDYPGLTTGADLGLPRAEGILMTYAEVEFLLAEAAAKGWISTDIETHYRNGIEASMTQHFVNYTPFGWTDFNDFYDNSGVAYSTITDIWRQKWLALFFTGLEPYFEVRRWYYESGMSWAGIPFLDAPCSDVNNGQLPLRFLYPGEEQSLNAVNYQTAISNLGGSNDQNAKMWLME